MAEVITALNGLSWPGAIAFAALCLSMGAVGVVFVWMALR